MALEELKWLLCKKLAMTSVKFLLYFHSNRVAYSSNSENAGVVSIFTTL